MLLKKLAGQTAIYGISSIVARLLNYLLTPYLTYFMTQAQYGVVTDMYALAPFLLVLLTLGMDSGYFRFAGHAATQQEKDRIFATTWGAVSLAALLFLGITLLFNNDIAAIMRYGDRPSYVWLIASIITLDVITSIPFDRLRQEGRAAHFVVVRVISVLINIAFCVFFYSGLPRITSAGLFPDPTDPGYTLVANLIASGATLLILLPSCGGIAPRIDRQLLRKIFLYSLPLLISGIAGMGTQFIDRQMLKYLLPADTSLEALGIYGAITKIGVILYLFTQMYRMAAEPFFLASFKKEDFVRTNAEALKYFMIVSVAIFLGIELFADLFALFVGPEFREGMFILPVVLGSYVLSGVWLNLSFWYKQSGQTRFAIYVTGTGLLITLLANWLLVPRLGYYGSAWARFASEAAMVAVSYYLNRKYCPTPYDLRRIGLYVLAGAVLYGIGFATEKLPAVAHYACNAILLGLFVLFAAHTERIDLRALVRSIVKRK